MKLWMAIAYRLFAISETPKKSLLLRLLGFVAVLSGLVWLLRRTIKYGLLQSVPMSDGVSLLLIALMTVSIVSLLFTMTHSYHMSSLSRLSLLHLLPIPHLRKKALYYFAFTPLIIVGLVSVALVEQRLFAGRVPALWFWAVFVGVFSASALLHVAVRIVDSPLARFAQPLSLLLAAVPLAIMQRIFLSLPDVSTPGCYASGAFLALVLLLAFALNTRRVRLHGDVAAARLYLLNTRLTIASSLLARALRSGRFLGAHALLLVIIGGLCGLSYAQPGMLDFNFAAAIAIFAIGTIPQEVRALSNHLYPTELVLYGRVWPWVVGMWSVTCLVGGLLIGGLLILTEVVFAGKLDISLAQYGSMAVALLVASVCISSLVVPRKKDIVSQLGTSFVYLIAAWAIFKYMGNLEVSSTANAFWFIGVVVVGGVGLSYALEKLRWIKTIRGNYGKIF